MAFIIVRRVLHLSSINIRFYLRYTLPADGFVEILPSAAYIIAVPHVFTLTIANVFSVRLLE